jgi:hypothetical protein
MLLVICVECRRGCAGATVCVSVGEGRSASILITDQRGHPISAWGAHSICLWMGRRAGKLAPLLVMRSRGREIRGSVMAECCDFESFSPGSSCHPGVGQGEWTWAADGDYPTIREPPERVRQLMCEAGCVLEGGCRTEVEHNDETANGWWIVALRKKRYGRAGSGYAQLYPFSMG